MSSSCKACNGTGCDFKKTEAMRKRESNSTGYVRCWTCNGNGLEPYYPGDYDRYLAAKESSTQKAINDQTNV